jgi:FkbM family methyltransferase
MFYSQAQQDKWVCDFFNYKPDGYFIEVGAFDGIGDSNTYFLEKSLNWKGISIEANEEVFNSLCKNRSSININIAINSFKGECSFDGYTVNNKLDNILIKCDTLNQVLLDSNADKNIDYLSLDIEGLEYEALESLNFNYWNIGLITVEHNLYCTNSIKKDKIYNLLTKNNFIRDKEDVLCLHPDPSVYGKPYEDWYINRKLLNK